MRPSKRGRGGGSTPKCAVVVVVVFVAWLMIPLILLLFLIRDGQCFVPPLSVCAASSPITRETGSKFRNDGVSSSLFPRRTACRTTTTTTTTMMTTTMTMMTQPTKTTKTTKTKYSLDARRSNGVYFEDDEYDDYDDYYDEEEEDDEYYYEDDDDEEDEGDDEYEELEEELEMDSSSYSRGRGWGGDAVQNLGELKRGVQDHGLLVPSAFGRRKGWRLPPSFTNVFLTGLFLFGIAAGMVLDSAIGTSPKDLSSRDAIDDAAPNAQLCATVGSSAMAFDQRVFVSFNPFSVYVAQADVKPACVLKRENVVPVLRERRLLNDQEVRTCKESSNTWAYVGDIDNFPQLSCVYQSQDAQNEFLSNPKLGIGEDVWDDDREEAAEAALTAMKGTGASSTGKNVKSGLTEAQKQRLREEISSLHMFH